MRRGALAALLLWPGAAACWELDARIEAEARWFPSFEARPAGAGHDKRLHGSLAATVAPFHGWRNDRERLAAELFVRRDAVDEARSHADARELHYKVIEPDFEFLLGVTRLYWGVTESRHLVDVINQSDFVEDLDGESRLGQPMADLSLVRGFGVVDLILMPYQRARTFPGPDGHPRLPFPVAADEARYESAQAQRHLDVALRYRGTFGPLDLGLAWFDGTAREPQLLACLRRGSGYPGTAQGPNCDVLGALPASPLPQAVTQALQALGLAPTDEQARADVLRNLVLVPYYPRLRQVSLDAQWIAGAMAWKLEGLAREQGGAGSLAAVAGFEYTFGDVAGSGWDVGLLGEYLHDQQQDFSSARFDHDWFAGTRVGLNDEAGTQLLAGLLVDRSGDDRLLQVEASRRLGDDWKLSTRIRVFDGIAADDVREFLEREDMVSVTVERFF